MKRRSLTLNLALFATLCAGNSFADPAPSVAPENPYAQSDPDGVPMSVSPWGKPPSAATQINGARKNANASSSNRNWLVQEYEKQERDHASSDPNKNSSSNLYLQLSMNKDLAKLAGIQPINPEPAANSAPAPHAETADKNGSSLRPDPTLNSQVKSFTPLITPLSSPGTVATMGGPSPWASAASPSAPGFLLPSTEPPATAETASAPSTSRGEASDLQTPGMVSAKDDPLGDTPDLTLDSLPGEPEGEAREHRDMSSKMELAVPLSADQVRAAQTATPTPTSLKKASPVQTASAPPKAIPVNPEDAPIQVKESPQISPVHAAVGNPYDILNR